MTRETTKELLPIIQAYANGKVIQVRGLGESESQWREAAFGDDLGFYESNEYRIKPEPRKFILHRCTAFTGWTVLTLAIHNHAECSNGETMEVVEILK